MLRSGLSHLSLRISVPKTSSIAYIDDNYFTDF